MKVKKLKEYLEKFKDTDIVVLSKDGEGNSYSPLADLGAAHYAADTSWSGEIYTGEDLGKRKLNAVVLWPVN